MDVTSGLSAQMNRFFLVFIAGGLGSLFRFALTLWALARWGSAFPYGTLCVNVLGCFLIGLMAGLPLGMASLPPPLRVLLVTGFLGGFTTFSAYQYESFLLWSEGFPLKAFLNMGGSVVVGFLAVLFGVFCMRSVAQLVLK